MFTANQAGFTAVSYAVQRGEKMAKKQGYRLESEVI